MLKHLFIRLLISFSLFYAHATMASECALNIKDIEKNNILNDAVSKFGGLTGLTGEYTLSGFLGLLKSTKVAFKQIEDKFWVSVNKDTAKQVALCNKKNEFKKEYDLHLKILEPKKQENADFLLRSATEDKVFISGNESGWKFMKFKKTKSDSTIANNY